MSSYESNHHKLSNLYLEFITTTTAAAAAATTTTTSLTITINCSLQYYSYYHHSYDSFMDGCLCCALTYLVSHVGVEDLGLRERCRHVVIR